MLTGMLMLERAQDGLIGRDAVRTGPFGPRRVTYADYTASGRAVDLIEDALRRDVLPWYANTHTESSTTGRRTSRLREQARQAVRHGVGGDDTTAVIFCGSGTTAAIEKFIGMLGLRRPTGASARERIGEPRPVVFVGPYEHHSNEVSWRETTADVVVIPLDDCGRICASTLEAELLRHADRPLRIGSFSAASNVTGVLTDTAAISRLLHRHGALSCWDYAAAATYVDIAMTTRRQIDPLDHKDAVFLSPHKMVGGPGSPGVLAVRRDLAANSVPVVPGGGTVRFVSPWAHDYVDDVEHREEGGTPDIVGSIRAGLAFRLKAAIGTDLIGSREERHLARALAVWSEHPTIEVLGPTDGARLPIMSLRIRTPSGAHLHHNLVVAMLDDLFGIQARGGCSCAGPYAHRLLGIDPQTSDRLRSALTAGGNDGARYGWARVGLSYVLTDAEVDLIIRAVAFVAEHGWTLMSQYRFSPETGIWCHVAMPADPSCELDALLQPQPPSPTTACIRRDDELTQYLAEAAAIVGSLADARMEHPPPTSRSDVFESLRWFDLPESSELV